MNRLKKAWRVLWGEDLGSQYPHKLIQLMYFQDSILGLDGNGDIYKIDTWPNYNGSSASVSLWLKNPVSRW